MSEITINRAEFIDGLHEVTYYCSRDNQLITYLQTPSDILTNIRSDNLNINFIHFYGKGRIQRTYRKGNTQEQT